MPTYSNIVPTAETDGVLYANAVPLTPNEAILGDALVCPTIIPVAWGQVIVAVLKFAITGYLTGNNSYVVMQTDLGDDVWADVAWANYTDNQTIPSRLFILGGKGHLAGNTSQQQVRQSGEVPSPINTVLTVPLMGRVRFVGKSVLVGGSSSAAGLNTGGITVTIKYKLLGLR